MIFIDKLDLTKHYNEICNLWNSYSLDHISLDLLSPFGVVALNEKKELVGVMFFYLSYAAPTCLLRFPVLDKNINKKTVFNKMLNNSHDVLRSMGYKYILCSTNNKGLISYLEDNKYSKSFDNCSHLEGVL